jgi:hypothetical protein
VGGPARGAGPRVLRRCAACPHSLRRRVAASNPVTPTPHSKAEGQSAFGFLVPGSVWASRPKGRSWRPAPEAGKLARVLGFACVHRSPIATGHPS